MNFGIQNGLQTGFQNGFQTGFQNNLQMGNNFNIPNNRFNQEEEEEEENTRYPGLKPDQIERLEMVADQQGLKGQEKINYMDDLYRQLIPTINNQNTLDKRDEEINRMHYDESKGDISKRELKKQKNRLIDLAQQVKKIYPDMVSADEDDEVVIQNFIVGLQQAGYNDAYKDYAEYIKSGDKDKFFSKYNLSNNTTTVKEDTGFPLGLTAGALTVGGIYGGSFLGGPVERLGRRIYGNNIPVSNKEASNVQWSNKEKIKNDYRIEQQAKEVKRLEKEMKGMSMTDDGYELLKSEYDDASKKLEELKGTNIKEANTAVDTAYEHGIVGTKDKMADIAAAKKDILWEDHIQKIIDENPNVEINLKDVFSDWKQDVKTSKFYGKKIEEQSSAMKNMERWFNRNSDLEHASLKDVQELKSAIEEDLADMYEARAKGNSKVITEEEKMLEGYVKKLRTTLQDKLQELAPDENVKQIYKQWADLDNIAHEGLKQKKLKGDVGTMFKTKAKEAVGSRVGKNIMKQGKNAKKFNEFLRTAPKNAKNWLKKGIKGIVKGGRLFTLLEDGSIIPGSPTNIASKNVDAIIEGMVYRGTKKKKDKINAYYDEFMEEYNSIPENERTKADELVKNIYERTKNRINNREEKYRGTIKEEIIDTLWNGAYKDYLNGDREAFDSIYTDELIEKVISGEEELPIFI